LKELVILTGYSGAGKSTAAGLIEDLGFFCIDNLPPDATYQVANIVAGSVDKLAIVLDVRSYLFGDVKKAIKDLKDRFNFCKVVFLTAKKDVLIQRFAHTRRTHPLSKQTTSISEAIDLETELMSGVIEVADVVIDTSQINPHQLREKLTNILSSAGSKKSIIHIISFGFKYGMPLDADFVFDARFFPNPFYIPELRQKDGRDQEVRDFLKKVDGVDEYLHSIFNIVSFAAARYESEGRNEITIAIGCTGGRHRSVYFAEEIKNILEARSYQTTVEHRDVDLG